MLNIPEDIQSLTEFKRNTSELLRQLKATQRPMVLTVNGRAAVVVQDARSYQELVERVEAIERIERGLQEARAGKTRSARKALNSIARKHKISKE